jgi:hypothetical protein
MPQNPEEPTREISETLGENCLIKVKSQEELRKIKKEISELEKKLGVLKNR